MSGRSDAGIGPVPSRQCADGDFGKDTQEAVRRFQADKKLTVDSIAGLETLAVFKKQHAVATVQCRTGGTALTAQGLLWMSTTA